MCVYVCVSMCEERRVRGTERRLFVRVGAQVLERLFTDVKDHTGTRTPDSVGV